MGWRHNSAPQRAYRAPVGGRPEDATDGMRAVLQGWDLAAEGNRVHDPAWQKGEKSRDHEPAHEDADHGAAVTIDRMAMSGKDCQWQRHQGKNR